MPIHNLFQPGHKSVQHCSAFKNMSTRRQGTSSNTNKLFNCTQRASIGGCFPGTSFIHRHGKNS
jgi:hypothetical protein